MTRDLDDAIQDLLATKLALKRARSLQKPGKSLPALELDHQSIADAAKAFINSI